LWFWGYIDWLKVKIITFSDPLEYSVSAKYQLDRGNLKRYSCISQNEYFVLIIY